MNYRRHVVSLEEIRALPQQDMHHVQLAFEALHAVADPIADDASFHNGTGYFDPIPRLSHHLGNGMAAFTDANKRKVLVLWDPISQTNIVVFQRYANRPDLLIFNRNGGRYPIGAGMVEEDPHVQGFLLKYTELASVQEKMLKKSMEHLANASFTQEQTKRF